MKSIIFVLQVLCSLAIAGDHTAMSYGNSFEPHAAVGSRFEKKSPTAERLPMSGAEAALFVKLVGAAGYKGRPSGDTPVWEVNNIIESGDNLTIVATDVSLNKQVYTLPKKDLRKHFGTGELAALQQLIDTRFTAHAGLANDVTHSIESVFCGLNPVPSNAAEKYSCFYKNPDWLE